MPNKYPEYQHYEKGWLGTFQNRLRREGLLEQAKERQKVIKKEQNCNDGRAWVLVCDEYPPLAVPAEDAAGPSPQKPPRDLPELADVTVADDPDLTMKLYDAALWAFQNFGVKTKRVAPSQIAYNILRQYALNEEGFLDFFERLEKRQTKTEGKDWARDDDEELASLLEQSLRTVQAKAARQRTGICPACAQRLGGESPVPEGTTRDLSA